MPQHAQLPLWADKTPEQKMDVLRQMVDDLYRYQLQEAYARMIHLLDEHTAADAKEADDMASIRRMIEAHPNLLNMNCEVGHLTGSALVIDVTSGKIILHYHKWLKRWLQFGGHADYETDMADVALREAREESGLPDLRFFPNASVRRPIDFDVHTIPESRGRPEHLHLDFRYLLATTQADKLSPQAEEVDTFKWLTFAEVYRLSDEIDASLMRLIRKAEAIYKVAVGT